MASVQLKQVEKVYPNGFKAVHGINLTIREGEFMVFVGPSGCAKSTTLRMIAGLEEISGGDIYIGEQRVNDLAPKDRGISMVFQNYALYPHMSVYENMAFGLKQLKLDKQEIEQRIAKTAKTLEIDQLLKRKPGQLSGGQRQRVALGRAIVRKPDVFLFDEPLSNLDAKLRVSTRVSIAQLHSDLKAQGQSSTMIYVTHDQVEAMTLGDRICVLDQGKIMQVDTPMNLYLKPANKFVAGFIGSPAMNLLKAKLVSDEGQLAVELSTGQRLRLPKEKAHQLQGASDEPIWFGIRPEDITLIEKNQPAEDGYAYLAELELKVREAIGKELYLYFDIDEHSQLVMCYSYTSASDYPTGQRYQLAVDMHRCHLFSQKTEQALF